MKARILFAEDDINLGFVTKDNLETEGYEITHCMDGAMCWETFQEQQFDLCILDVMLPKMDGFALAQKIRQQDNHIPILFLTAKSMKEDRIAGLKLGADDYITKPFSIEELILKIEVFLRRSRKETDYPAKETSVKKPVMLGKYTFDFQNLKLSCSQEEKKLTYREAEVLAFMYAKINQVIKREDLLEQIWGENDYFHGRSLDVFISRLRKYLSEDNQVKIENIHGIGFKLSIA